MKFITRKDYIEYLKKNTENVLREESQDYLLETEKIQYNKEKLEKINKKHDKIIKIILGQKKEVINFLNHFLKVKKLIEEDQIELFTTEFITWQYKNKYSDMIYKLKKEPIYFLIEHQSTVDSSMIERIGIYVQEIMRKEEKMGLYPIVVPIVIYTGEQKWNAKINFMDKQYISEEYDKYRINFWYNLITIQDYTFEELLEKKSLFSTFMMIEKCKTKDELITRLNQVIRGVENDKEIIKRIIVPYVGEEIADKLLKEIKEKEEVAMSPLTKMFLDLEMQSERRGERRGEKRGEKRGKKKGEKIGEKRGERKSLIKIAQKMLEKKMEIQVIEEITGLTQEEIEKLDYL